jgi:hypothetical protein
MNNLNGSVKMKVNAKNPATAHTLDRWRALEKKFSKY